MRKGWSSIPCRTAAAGGRRRQPHQEFSCDTSYHAAFIATALAFGTARSGTGPARLSRRLRQNRRRREEGRQGRGLRNHRRGCGQSADQGLRDALSRIKVEYSDLNSTELYNRFIAEAAANNGTADVLWSSAMDLQVKLVADGQAATLSSPEIKGIAEMGGVEDAAYGTTYEPITLRLQQAAGAGSATCRKTIPIC